MTPPEPGHPFDAPWQAQAFALAVALHAAGAFTWAEWTDALAARLDGRPGADHWAVWLETLEALATARGYATQAGLSATAAAWLRAARATPHGRPIRLENAPRDDGDFRI